MQRSSFHFAVGLLALSLFVSAASAQTDKAKKVAPKKRAPNPALQQIEDDPKLPRVLLIGDSISMGYTVPVRELMAGQANIHHPPENCGPTTNGVAKIDAWLGDKKWDVIHFNWGLHDLKYIAADSTALVDPKTEGARQQVPMEQYEANLKKLVARLKESGAKLIWCSTTPVPEGASGRVADDAVRYNEAAARVMAEAGVSTNDLHAFALSRLSAIQLPKNVHFSPEGSKALAEAVVKAVAAQLPKP